jgi:farnesyl-diphosphate farnesyltransferase
MNTRALRALSRPVARSFHLSLVLLPEAMRHPALLAYLLARMSDAVADAPGPFAQAREDILQRWLDTPERMDFPAGDFPSTATPGELHLWENRESLGRALIHSSHRTLIVEVWREILAAQLDDVRRERMGEAHQPLPWPEVLRYAEAVAGSVGIFWTRLLLTTCPGQVTGHPEAMMLDARSYGVALQLVNILRDSTRDHALGRAYLHPQDFPRARQAVERGLSAGRRYALGLRSWRLRLASGLPERIARDMLPDLAGPVPAPKVTRSRLWQLVGDTLWHAWWP